MTDAVEFDSEDMDQFIFLAVGSLFVCNKIFRFHRWDVRKVKEYKWAVWSPVYLCYRPTLFYSLKC